ncbi:alpha/beta hydrolase [Mycolicibacterium moriokaense]|uniref:Acetyl esterase n=1 Tax=Mycolicibacterium moriokaense TaxID=39691 RepID=A0A318HVG7_9MYCO|nr:alpha/beta hydrolase [Mycolicibacterium moriokaense]PXX12289.1 acetyl esterase [Mycolicibacterium moriokaense]
MTQSLPGQVTTVGSPRGAKGPVVNALAGLTLRGLPRIPNPVKRVMLGGRSVTIDGNTLDTTLQLMLFGMSRTGLNALIASLDVGAARTQLRILAASFKQDIPVASVTNLSIPGPAGPIGARHYRPINGDGQPLLVFYHGGGQVIGDIETHDDLCRQICREGGMHVLSVDYRLAPEHKAPAGAEDAYAAFGWALDHAGELGADAGRVAVGGDSAGGNLAAVVSQRARDEGTRLPALQLLFYPVTNYASGTRSQALFDDGFFLTKKDLVWCGDHFLNGARVDAADPRVSPLLADDLSGLPPALVLTAGFDPLRDEGRQYAEAMRAAGVAVDYREFGSLVHGFANFFPVGGGCATATTESISALRAHLART